MAFSSNSGGGAMADINVTPLVDVMLVLLIIFMVTMPIQSVPVDVDLPQKTDKPPENPKEPPEPISLRIDASGQVFWNDTPTPVTALEKMMETEVERVIWYNTDRRQEGWINSLFAGVEAPCVHALRTFEESLLATWVADANEAGAVVDLRMAGPQAPRFAETILGIQELEDAPSQWQEFLGAAGAKVRCGFFNAQQPVMAFLNER